MAEILIAGYYGFHNAGDEAMLAGLRRAIRELRPDVTFTAISGTASQTRNLHGIRAVSRSDLRAIWEAIGHADLVMFGGGSLLQDVTSSRSLIYYLGLATMAWLRRKPVMFCAQGIGPVHAPPGPGDGAPHREPRRSDHRPRSRGGRDVPEAGRHEAPGHGDRRRGPGAGARGPRDRRGAAPAGRGGAGPPADRRLRAPLEAGAGANGAPPGGGPGQAAARPARGWSSSPCSSRRTSMPAGP